MMKNFLDITDIVDGVREPISSATFLSMIGRLRFLIQADDYEELVEYVGSSTKNAAAEIYPSSGGHIQLLAAAIWHWSEDLKQYDNGRIDHAQIQKVYERIDALKPGMLPERYRSLRQGQWPVGLQHSALHTHDETELELFNRLWQLFWFMRCELFVPGGNEAYQLAHTMPIVYRTTSKDAHPPLWW